ncbi:MAG: glycosyltransferase family 2 protein [Chitinophagaceae bacterium]
MSKLSVAVVILNYNGKHHLQKFLPSVMSSTYSNLQIIIADNASTDDSLSFVAQHYPAITILKNTSNMGFAGGYNWALELVEADVFVLLNSDVEVTPDWIQPIINLMEADLTIAACQPKLLSYKEKHLFEYAGASGGWIDFLGYPFSRGRVFDCLEVDKGQYNTTDEIFWASGAALFIRSECFKEVDGFDSRFFAHQEEIDLCWRLKLKGYKIFACPTSVVYHVGAGTLPRGGQKVFLNFRNNLWMLCKNLPLHEKVWKLPFRFTLDGISAWKGLINGDVSFFSAIFFAHLSIIKLWILGQLQPITYRKNSKFLSCMVQRSIVYKHFVKGISTFDTIFKN